MDSKLTDMLTLAKRLSEIITEINARKQAMVADINPAIIRELEEARGIAATRGHCAGNGGLRGHSVGGVFPCVIYSYGNPNDVLVWGFISPDSEEHEGYTSYDEAYAAAESWLNGRAQ